ncbi:ribonuclease E/G, partial [candidate division WOR-3 bacterium]|nr:ribonuclease E/G [candidate division WOR-3 bacterium]
MKKQIILNIRRDDVRVAVREDGELTQFYIERGSVVSSVGNIIKGRIESIREELKAAFVDIGENEAGFLPLKDLYVSIPDKKNIDIGREIIVQVKKEAYGTKGARLTTFIAIPGRYLVLLPLRKLVGISRNIRDKKDRKKIQIVAEKIRPKNMGLIIRT